MLSSRSVVKTSFRIPIPLVGQSAIWTVDVDTFGRADVIKLIITSHLVSRFKMRRAIIIVLRLGGLIGCGADGDSSPAKRVPLSETRALPPRESRPRGGHLWIAASRTRIAPSLLYACSWPHPFPHRPVPPRFPAFSTQQSKN